MREIQGTSKDEMVEADVQDAAGNLVAQTLKITRQARENVPLGKVGDQSTCVSWQMRLTKSIRGIEFDSNKGLHIIGSKEGTLKSLYTPNQFKSQKKSSILPMSLQILLQKCAGESSLSAT